MQNLMRQAQKMQEQMQQAEKELEETEVVGIAGANEAVVVYMNGKKIIDGVEFGDNISELVDLSDPDDVEMLEDLIMAAINDGYKKADVIYEQKMGPFGGLGGAGGLF